METRVAIFVVAISLMVAVALGAVPGQPAGLAITPGLKVDGGIEVTMTCTEVTEATSYRFQRAGADIADASIANNVLTLTAVVATDHNKEFTCKAVNADGPSQASTAKTLEVFDVPAPTLRSDISEVAGKVTVDNGYPVRFTCEKNTAANQDPVSIKFYEGANEIKKDTAGAVIDGGNLTLTVSATWDAKVIKCNHYNADAVGSNADSTKTYTLAVEMVPNRPNILFKTPLIEGTKFEAGCEKVGDVKVTGFEFYENGKKLESGVKNNVYTVAKVTKADHNGKKYKCRALNTVGDSRLSEEKTLEVTDGAASQLVSMTTMALVLVLGAFFKE